MPLLRVTAPYRPFESWAYDRIIAPAVLDLRAPVEGRLLGELPSGAKLLEVGCGGGQLATFLAERRADVSVVGLDLSAEQVARARRRGARFGERVRFVEGTALELPFPAESFDAVVSVASIKHWPDRAKGLGECERVLRPGGNLAVIEADRGCALGDARAFVARWRVPWVMREVLLMVFRTYVAGQGLDLDEARALLAGLSLTGAEVQRIPGTPGLILAGRKTVLKLP